MQIKIICASTTENSYRRLYKELKCVFHTVTAWWLRVHFRRFCLPAAFLFAWFIKPVSWSPKVKQRSLLEVLENKLFVMLFGLKTEGENRVLKNLKICAFSKHYWGRQGKGYEVGRVCSTHGNLYKNKQMS
jgi:hypothetical protein